MSRREERERLRAERLAAQSAAGSSERRRLIVGYVVAGVLGLAVLAGLVAVIAGGGDDGNTFEGCSEAAIEPNSGGSFNSLEPDCRKGTPPPALQQGDLALAAKAAGCELREDLPDEGATHVDNNTPVTYGTNPPTSGNHNPVPVADGAYLTPLRANPDTAGDQLNIRNFVHALEHGRIEIQYSSKLSEEDQLALKGVFDEDPAGMLMFPNDDMPDAVAATAWQQLLACPRYNPAVLDAIRNFRDIYRGQGPENIPIDL